MSTHESNTTTPSTGVDTDAPTQEQQDEFVIDWLLRGLTPLEDAPRLPARSQTKDTCGFCGEYNGRLNKLGECRDCSL